MKKFNCTTNGHKFTLQCTDKIFKNAEETLKSMSGKMKSTWASVDSILDHIADMMGRAGLPSTQKTKAILYYENDGYAKSCKYKKLTMQATVRINGNKVTSIDFDRAELYPGEYCTDKILTDSKEAREHFLKKFLGVNSPSQYPVRPESHGAWDECMEHMYDYRLYG